ncbi:hypothetical protein EDC62_0205 [Tibeticola sediminis]|uniref:Uncharacterized protein n=1 Tax=Tibeticola sediminis TaxID=1917811 RepID=A0A3N4VHV2_9BURK|nr:hypothetical protein [Tibeticola sediminis]RPE72514.1 hypothetical protein EDC62_0205 [Tibeticola sediminis]
MVGGLLPRPFSQGERGVSLIERIECGLATVEDAWIVAALMRRLARYELTLKDIAVHGDAGAAMKALEALAESFRSVPVAAGVEKECE